MNSKGMGNWSLIFLLFSVVIITYRLIADEYQPEVFYILIVSAVFNVGSAIMKKLESFDKE